MIKMRISNQPTAPINTTAKAGLRRKFHSSLWASLTRIMYGNPAKHMRVIVVTGTSGKTTTACYINEILKEAKFKTALFTATLSEVGGKVQVKDGSEAVSVAKLQRFFRDARRTGAEYVVVEATSQLLLRRCFSGVLLEAVVLTNITDEHLHGDTTMDEYLELHDSLFELQPRFIILNRDDEWFNHFDAFIAREHKMTYGKHPESEANITHTKLYRRGTEADVILDHQTHLELATALPGEYNVHHMTAAVTLTYLLGVKLEDMQEGVANVELVPGRFQRVVDQLPYDVIVDYACTPYALERAVSTAQKITKNRVILVCGASDNQTAESCELQGEVAARYADRIFLTEEEHHSKPVEEVLQSVWKGISRSHGEVKTTEIAERKEAIERAISIAQKGDIILITGLGHRQTRFMNGERRAWNDAQVAAKIARARHKL